MTAADSARRLRPHPALTVLQPLVQTVSEGPWPINKHARNSILRDCQGCWRAWARPLLAKQPGTPRSPPRRSCRVAVCALLPELQLAFLRSCCICEWESARDSAPEGEGLLGAAHRCAVSRPGRPAAITAGGLASLGETWPWYARMPLCSGHSAGLGQLQVSGHERTRFASPLILGSLKAQRLAWTRMEPKASRQVNWLRVRLRCSAVLRP